MDMIKSWKELRSLLHQILPKPNISDVFEKISIIGHVPNAKPKLSTMLIMVGYHDVYHATQTENQKLKNY